MSRSVWKFYNIEQVDLKKYLNEYTILDTSGSKQKVYLKNNKLRINNINYMHRYIIKQYKFYSSLKFCKYNISEVIGSFIKNKKPFFFREKKKKKCLKK